MKRFAYILTAVAATLVAAVACVEQEEYTPFQPGNPDVESCYGVYFPAQETAGYHVYDPEMAREVSFTAKRTNSNGAITVPVILTSETAEVFTADPLSFADGQDETTFKVKFPEITLGTKYAFSIAVKDPQYASMYADGATSIDFSVLQVKWEYFTKPNSTDKAKIHWVQGWWGEEVDAYIKYYEVDGVRYCFTETIPDSHYYKGYYTGYGFFGTGDDEASGVEWEFVWYTNAQNSLGYDLIQLDTFTGYHHSSYDADVWACDYFCLQNRFNNKNYLPWVDYALKYGDPDQGDTACSYYDGNGGFFFSAYRYYMAGLGGWAPDPYDTFGIAEGFSRPVYSISVAQTAVCAGGKVPVSFVIGADATAVAYAFVEGTLTPTQVANTVEAFDDKSQYLATPVSGTYEFELAKTGTYTLVAATFAPDSDNKLELKSSASCEITYLAAADTEAYAVEIGGGVGSAAKYVTQGANTDTAIEFYVYGKNITEAKIAAFSVVDLAKPNDCVAALMKKKSLDADALAELNGNGYVGVFTNLLPGTEYYMMVYATNGYEETVEVFGSETTTGDPLPVYQTFSVDSYYAAGELENAAAWCGTWNIYGIDYDGTTGLREYLGKSVITPSATPTEGPDSNGLYDEYVYVTGMFGDLSWLANYGIACDDTFEMDVYDGLMYSCSKTLVNDPDGLFAVYIYSKGNASFGFDYADYYFQAFIPVMDGYYALVDVSQYAASYNFCGFGLVYNNASWINRISEQLLVDPAKDNNGLAPASINHAIAAAQDRMNESVAEVDNCVLSDKGRIRTILDSYKAKTKGVTAYGTIADIKGAEMPLKTVKVKSVEYAGPAVKVSARERNLTLLK